MLMERQHPDCQDAILRTCLDSSLFAMLLLLALLSPASGEDYYISTSTGDDLNVGTSTTAPWKSLKRASKATLAPGDRLLLRAGDRFSGTLQLRAQGSIGHEIVVSAYGSGSKPLIEGFDADACIHLHNPSHLVVKGLELTNPNGLYGIHVTAHGAGELGTVILEQLDIHDVYRRAWSYPEAPGHGEYKRYGGINVQVMRGNRPSWWKGLIIRNCEIHDLGTCGISVASAYPLHEKLRHEMQTESFPIRGLVIEDNIIRDIARDGAMVRQCVGAVIENNQVMRTGKTSISNGIWFWDCIDSVMRYNVGSECGVKGRADGAPFSIDGYCRDCRIEYNYCRDNEGPAFIVFGNDDSGTGSIVRGNVSFNDATVEAKPGFAVMTMVSRVNETVVEDNIVIAGPKTRSLMGHHDWQGVPTDVTYRGNIFVGNGRARVEESVLQGGQFDGNLFFNVPKLPFNTGAHGDDAGKAFVEAMLRIRLISSGMPREETTPDN